MLTQTIKEIAKVKEEVDARQIAEVLWLSQFMKSSTLSKSKEKVFEDFTEPKTISNDELHRTISPKISISSKDTKREVSNYGFERDNDSTSTFSTVIEEEPKKFNLEKEFRVLTQKVKRQSNEDLDEIKTAEYIASVGLFEPIFREHKVRENYFYLSLVIDKNSSMFLWQESIESFVESLKNLKVFRGIDIFYLDSSENEASFTRENSIKKLAYNSASFKKRRSLTLVLSDVVGKAWRSNQMFTVLDAWSKYSFVTIVSMLPDKMWQKTPLRQGVSLFVTADKFPVSNQRLRTEYELEDLEHQLNIPIIPFNARAFGYLNNLLMLKKESWIDARLFQTLPNLSNKTDNPIKDIESKERVEKFLASANEDARVLAIYCSVLPLNKAIVKAVIRFKSLGKNMDAFAEFYFGGLLDKSISSSMVEYEFYKGVRAELMAYISVEEVKSLFYLLNEVISKSLKLKGSVVDLLFSHNMQRESFNAKEKALAELLIEVLGVKGSFFEKEKENLIDKLNFMTIEMIHLPKVDQRKRGRIDYEFALGKHPITIREYMYFVKDKEMYYPEWLEKDNKYNLETGTNNLYKNMNLSDNAPIIGINWYDAIAYCEWLSTKTGDKYRLPTEKEWEYACRSDSSTKWSFGNDIDELEKYAWYRDNSNNNTHEVKCKKENSWGFYDMHGNVWEWCADWYDNKKKQKVLRGGSWGDPANNTSSSFRGKGIPTYRGCYRGFRVLKMLSNLKEKSEEEGEKKAKIKAERLANEERLKKEKEGKKEEGLNALLDCTTLEYGFKLLKYSFGKKPKPTNEEKEIIAEFKKRFKKLSKGDIKTFSKYGV